LPYGVAPPVSIAGRRSGSPQIVIVTVTANTILAIQQPALVTLRTSHLRLRLQLCNADYVFDHRPAIVFLDAIIFLDQPCPKEREISYRKGLGSSSEDPPRGCAARGSSPPSFILSSKLRSTLRSWFCSSTVGLGFFAMAISSTTVLAAVLILFFQALIRCANVAFGHILALFLLLCAFEQVLRLEGHRISTTESSPTTFILRHPCMPQPTSHHHPSL
ncbi:hypothetical protein PIB30_046349, partial [Stylosanthes scabra]|nr:hypothetical protein [Stylosanthes scabra]